MLKNNQEIFEKLQDVLNELFEIDISKITLEAKLYEDLDLDSIDAVDLIVHLQNLTQHKFKPEEFKAVKTVADVVDVIYNKIETA